MATLHIDRLEAHYHEATTADVARFDESLAALVRGGLDAAVLGASYDDRPVTGTADAAWAVCIDAVRVNVTLDPGDGRVVGRWSDAIVAEVASRIAGAQTAPRVPLSLENRSGAGTKRHAHLDTGTDGVVVYPTEADALFDLAAGWSLGDHRRVWAWQLAGLVDHTSVDRSDVVAALVRRPELAPAVLGALRRDALHRLLRPDDAVRLAHAAARAGGTPSTSLPPANEADRASAPTRSAPRRGDDALARRCAALLPRSAWQAAVTTDRVALAALSIAVLRPGRARDPELVRAVLAAATSAHDPDAPTRPPDAGRATTRDRHDEVAPAEPSDEDVVTDWGGVWFLLHAVAELEIAERLLGNGADPALLVMRLLADVTGAPVDEPGLAVLVGQVPPDDEPVDGWDELCDELVAWIDRRLERDDRSPGWPWWRRAVVHDTLALVELEFDRSSVDVEVRVAGLDLDPGWVWWLGAFVRFRYV